MTKGWYPDEDITVSDEVINALQNFHKQQKEYQSSSEEWSTTKIFSKLNEYGTRRKPTDFQLRNLQKMLLRPSAASFSVPGSGKTSEGLCYWLCRKSIGERLLVVLPKVGFLAWEEEFKHWLNWGSSKVIRLDKSGDSLIGKVALSDDAEVYLITYARLHNNVENLSYIMQDGNWSMILDESHNIKNSKGAYSRSVRNVGSFARKTKLILTGTPAPQGSQDLVSQVEFLRNAKMNVEDSVKWIKAIKVRTTKEQLGLIAPEFIEYVEELPLAHQRLYDLLTSAIARKIEAEGNLGYAAKLANLRRHIMDIMRAASNPRILCQKEEFSEILSPEIIANVLTTPSWKVKKVSSLVSEIISGGKKVIIWSNFNENTDALAAELKHLSPRIIRGDTPSSSSEDEELDASTREGILNDFKTLPTCNVIIANPAACGESISLHHWCHDAIYFDRNYNAGQFLQSCDRIHRYGSLPDSSIITCAKVQVRYHILKSAGTIDEIIARRLNSKIKKQEKILSDDDYLRPLIEPGTEANDLTGMSDEDRLDFLEHLPDCEVSR